MSYIKKIHIVEDETGGIGNYTKRVEVVEVLDSQGNPGNRFLDLIHSMSWW